MGLCMLKYDLIIIAAGEGTRLKNHTTVPKALIKINGECNLLRTINLVWNKFRKVFVVSSKRNHKLFQEELKCLPKIMAEKVELIGIDSGKGDGHAVLKAIHEIYSDQDGGFQNAQDDEHSVEKFFVMWGDAYLTDPQVFDECMEYDDQYNVKPMLIPVVMEKDPYVSFLVDENMNCISADFSKRGEHHPNGYHDQSIFLCCTICVQNSLEILDAAYNKNGRYITDSGENTFLYVIHYFYNIDFPAKALVVNPCTKGFNTREEIIKIENEEGNI